MRTRDLKPDFWSDERVVLVSDSAKLLFQGLWNLADRCGRLEDKPVTIGFKVRPWDPSAVPTLLTELQSVGLIIRYSVNGLDCIGVPGLVTHQRIHPKEMASKLPDWNDLEASRVKVDLSAAGRGKKGNSHSLSEPSGSSGPSKVPRGRAAPDPRHAPLVKELCEVFAENLRAPYPFKPRDAKAVSELLALESVPERISTVWRQALRSTGYPTVRTLPELVTHFAHFVGSAPSSTRDDMPTKRPEGITYFPGDPRLEQT